MGSMGARARSSQATKAASRRPSPGRTRARPGSRSTRRRCPGRGPARPRRAPRWRARARARRTACAPARGSRSGAGGRAGSRRSPIGTFSQKIHFHEIPCTIAPPTTGPRAIAMPPTAPQAPSARPRRSAGTAAERIVSVSGVTMAAPIPWTIRARINAVVPGDRAAAAEPSVKTARPTMSMRRRPKRSPSVAPVSSRTANDSVYAFIGPLEARERRVELDPDHRQRGRDHQVVERPHEQRHRRDDEGPDCPCPSAHRPSSYLGCD